MKLRKKFVFWIAKILSVEVITPIDHAKLKEEVKAIRAEKKLIISQKEAIEKLEKENKEKEALLNMVRDKLQNLKTS